MASNDVALLEDSLSKTGAIISGVTAEQLQLQTPCSEFSAEDIINHLVGWSNGFAGRLTSNPSEVDPNAYKAGADPTAEFDSAAATIVGLAVGKSMLKPEYRGPDKFFAEEFPVSTTDTSVEHLVAFLGRDPHWKA
ncbi:MAG: hypothetical protein Q7L55_11605 [Actinomycetota bacterium]|nr:hypothetical protein [Actinomycetota bacterium]